MKVAITRFDYMNRGGTAWIRIEGEAGDSALQNNLTFDVQVPFAVRSDHAQPPNDAHIFIAHPAASAQIIDAWFFDSDVEMAHSGQRSIRFDRATYRDVAAQSIAERVAAAEIEEFGPNIPTIRF